MLGLAVQYNPESDLTKSDLLALTAEHGVDVEDFVKLQLGDSLETFLQVRLHSGRVFGLGQNLQHFVVWQEKEPDGNWNDLVISFTDNYTMFYFLVVTNYILDEVITVMYG